MQRCCAGRSRLGAAGRARLPSIVSLAQEYGLAVTTVQKAVGALREEGLIVTSPMGTFVSEDQRPQA